MPIDDPLAGTIRVATRLSEITAAPPAYVRLDPEGGVVAGLDTMWKMAAQGMPGASIWTVDCSVYFNVCDQITPTRPKMGDPSFAVWTHTKQWFIYRGHKEVKALATWMMGFQQQATAAGMVTADDDDATKGDDDKLSPDELLQIGLRDMNHPNAYRVSVAVGRLERVIDTNFFKTQHEHNMPGQKLLSVLGRYRYQFGNDFAKARGHFERASRSRAQEWKDCARMQLSTLLASHPESIAHRNEVISKYHKGVDALLNRTKPISLRHVDDSDPFVFCMLPSFDHSLYYDDDRLPEVGAWNGRNNRGGAPTSAESAMRKYVRLAYSAFPDLNFTAAHLRGGAWPACSAEKIKIGIASAFFHPTSSVLQDFHGVLRRLPRDRFELTFIVINEKNDDDATIDQGVQKLDPQEKDEMILIQKADNPNHWLPSARETIGGKGFDVLLYLDLTMSTYAHRLAMGRLARVQATSHGHPVTSGIEESVDYYISWAAAELPTAQDHYTEKLALLPAHTMHQYLVHNFEERLVDGTMAKVSLNDGMPFSHLTRSDFAAHVPEDGNWYLCMQKPFKRFPEFDVMLSRVLEEDPNGRLLLHEIAAAGNQKIIAKRLEALGVDMERVHFIPVQPHSRLLALYSLSDVNLDSYPAGGCTTTREALALGAPVVTLPAKYLGSRWSAAFYSIMGVEELVAEDEDDYVRIAVNVGTDRELRESMKERILANVGKLFEREEAIEAWAALLTRIARGDRGEDGLAPTREEALGQTISFGPPRGRFEME